MIGLPPVIKLMAAPITLIFLGEVYSNDDTIVADLVPR